MPNDTLIRYPKFVGVNVSEEMFDWIPKPRSENIRKILEWAYESYPEDFNRILELMK